MKKPETKFKEKVVKDIDKLPYTWYVVVNMVALRGIPDIIVCCRGHFVGLELKMDPIEKVRKTPRFKLQQYTLEKIREALGTARVVYPDNWKEVHDQLKQLANGERHDYINFGRDPATNVRYSVTQAVQPRRIHTQYRRPSRKNSESSEET